MLCVAVNALVLFYFNVLQSTEQIMEQVEDAIRDVVEKTKRLSHCRNLFASYLYFPFHECRQQLFSHRYRHWRCVAFVDSETDGAFVMREVALQCKRTAIHLLKVMIKGQPNVGFRTHT